MKIYHSNDGSVNNFQNTPSNESVAEMSISGSLSDIECDSGFVCSVAERAHIDSFDDLHRLRQNYLELQESGFYYETLSKTDAVSFLEAEPLGTFLLRDSSHARYLYALSVKTTQGATSIRIFYIGGCFGFDGDDEWLKPKPVFKSVISLVGHYVYQLKRYGRGLAMKGKADRKPVHIELKKPLTRQVSTLAHLSRLMINSHLASTFMYELSIAELPMLKSDDVLFLTQYPYPF